MPSNGRNIARQTDGSDLCSTAHILAVFINISTGIQTQRNRWDEEWCLLGCYAVWLL
jgi:hypothetical protein